MYKGFFNGKHINKFLSFADFSWWQAYATEDRWSIKNSLEVRGKMESILIILFSVSVFLCLSLSFCLSLSVSPP